MAYSATILVALGSITSFFWDNLELLIALGGLYFTGRTIQQNTAQQKMTLFHDMVKEVLNLRKMLYEHEKSSKKNYPLLRQIYFDYWEYLAYLINNKKIDETPAKDLLKPEFKGVLEKVKKYCPAKNSYNEIKKLADSWN